MHERGDHRPRAGAGPGTGLRHRAEVASGAVLRIRLLLEGEALEAPRLLRRIPEVAGAVLLEHGTIDMGSEATSRVGRLSPSRRGRAPVVTFARAASDLEELFLQVTSPDLSRWQRLVRAS